MPLAEELLIAAECPTWRNQAVTVSGILITYNQESFVQAAVESVLGQTYPLDIIIADDASTDGTFAIIEKAVREYSGQHSIRILRAHRNRGICRNQNRALRLAEGELVVFFEGDDVSSRDRVAQLVAAYIQRDRAVGGIGSSVRRVNREGQPFEPEEEPAGGREAEMRPPGNGYLVGCGIAVRRECFSAFGPITERLISGDIALWMRADYVRNGGVLLVPRPLVDYRIHNENTSGRFSLRFSSRAALRASCAALLNNEIAQVVELKKIARYRLSAGLKDAALDRLWSRTFRVTRSRAALVLAIAKRPCREWLFPVVRSLRHRALRPLAVRALALGLCPPAYRIYLRLRGHHI